MAEEPWFKAGADDPAGEMLTRYARDTVVRITEREEGLTLARRFVLAAIEHPSFLKGSWRGHTMREHFNQMHPGEIELGVDGAPYTGVEREGWLWGYRWAPEVGA
jgi:hypothetical protein